MRLLMISSEFPPGPGGIGNHAYHLALNLHRLGWDVIVQSPQDYAKDEEIARLKSKLPFKLMRAHSGRGRAREALSRIRVGSRLVKEQRPDCLLGTGLSGVWVAAALSALRHLPMMAIAHGSEFGTVGGFSGWLNRRAFERATMVVAVSQFTRGMVEKAGIRARQLTVIPNAANCEEGGLLSAQERNSFRRKAGFDDIPLLLTVGHVSERKGQEVVIRALPLILQRVPRVQYLMIGLPTLEKRLRALAENLGVSEHVHFLGKVPDEEKRSWLNCCDVFLMTSRTLANGDCEGFGIAAIEAAMYGKPAVVSDSAGILEAIQDGVTGLAVPEGDSSATASAVVSLLGDRARCLAMGDAARVRALREQTWETCASKYDTLLRSLRSYQ